MKLYIYEHCPYCVRADMVARYREVSLQRVCLANDDEATPLALVGAKQVPILQFDDGHAIPESLDIVAALDPLGRSARRLRPALDPEPWLQPLTAVHTHLDCLLFPRVLQLGLAEFASAAARDYFRQRKEAVIGRSFAQALDETVEHMRAVEQALASMPALPFPADARLGMDDVLIFPTLRNLTMVRGLRIPHPVQDYLRRISGLLAMPDYTDRAV